MGKLSELLGETIDNQESYQKMVGLIKLALRMEGMRNLFVGVCDDTTNTKRTKLLNRLSKELSLDTCIYDTPLTRKQPDIVEAIRNVFSASHFKLDYKAVFSIYGADTLTEDNHKSLTPESPSPEERFFGHLQWSYLRWEHGENKEIEYPNILWLNSEMLVKVRRKAPDYCAHVNAWFYFDFEP